MFGIGRLFFITLTLDFVQPLPIRRDASPSRGRGYKGFCDNLLQGKAGMGNSE